LQLELVEGLLNGLQALLLLTPLLLLCLHCKHAVQAKFCSANGLVYQQDNALAKPEA